MRFLSIVVLIPLLAGCESGGTGSIFWHTVWDLLRGEPSEQALARSARFDEAGIAFDYPAVLRRRESIDEDGDRRWSLEYGMFELEMGAYRNDVRVADFLGLLGDMFAGGKRIDSEPLSDGATLTLCGSPVTATRLRLKLAGDWSELDGFDLPAPPGESRMLIFDDEPVAGKPSAIARATWKRVTASLHCDPRFVSPQGPLAASDGDTPPDP